MPVVAADSPPPPLLLHLFSFTFFYNYKKNIFILWPRSYLTRGRKLGIWLRVITKAKRGTFWPRPNMPRFQTRGKMWKITGAESPYYTRECFSSHEILFGIII